MSEYRSLALEDQKDFIVNEQKKVSLYKSIGKGCCSEVFSGIDYSNHEVAVKLFYPGPKYDGAYQREIAVLLSKAHEKSCIVNPFKFGNFDGRNYIIMERLQATLQEILSWNPVIGSVEFIHILARNMAFALKELHGKGFIHGDLKLSNVMWSPCSSSFKLIDFGLSYHHTEKLKHKIQSEAFKSPECKLFENVNDMPSHDCLNSFLSQPSFATDIWSYGCVLFMVMTKEKLLLNPSMCSCSQDPSNCDMKSNISSRLESIPCENNSEFLLKQLVSLCLRCNSKERPTAEEILNFDFIQLKFCGLKQLTIAPKLPSSAVIMSYHSSNLDDTTATTATDSLNELIRLCNHFAPIADSFIVYDSNRPFYVIEFSIWQNARRFLEEKNWADLQLKTGKKITLLQYYHTHRNHYQEKNWMKGHRLEYNQDIAVLHGACMSVSQNISQDEDLTENDLLKGFEAIKNAIINVKNRNNCQEDIKRIHAVCFFHFCRDKIGVEVKPEYFESININFKFLSSSYLLLLSYFDWKVYANEFFLLIDNQDMAKIIAFSLTFIKRYNFSPAQEISLFICFIESLKTKTFQMMDELQTGCRNNPNPEIPNQVPDAQHFIKLLIDILNRFRDSIDNFFKSTEHSDLTKGFVISSTLECVSCCLLNFMNFANVPADTSADYKLLLIDIFETIEKITCHLSNGDLKEPVLLDRLLISALNLEWILNYFKSEAVGAHSDTMMKTRVSISHERLCPVIKQMCDKSSKCGKILLEFLFSVVDTKTINFESALSQILWILKEQDPPRLVQYLRTHADVINANHIFQTFPDENLMTTYKREIYQIILLFMKEKPCAEVINFVKAFHEKYGLSKTWLLQDDFEQEFTCMLNQTLDCNHEQLLKFLLMALQNAKHVVEKSLELAFSNSKMATVYAKVISSINSLFLNHDSRVEFIRILSDSLLKIQNQEKKKLSAVKFITELLDLLDNDARRSLGEELVCQVIVPTLEDHRVAINFKLFMANIFMSIREKKYNLEQLPSQTEIGIVLRLLANFNILQHDYSFDAIEYRIVLYQIFKNLLSFVPSSDTFTVASSPVLDLLQEIEKSFVKKFTYEAFVLLLADTLPRFIFDEWKDLLLLLNKGSNFMKFVELHKMAVHTNVVFTEAVVDFICIALVRKKLSTANLQHTVLNFSKIVKEMMDYFTADSKRHQLDMLLMVTELCRLKKILSGHEIVSQLLHLISEVENIVISHGLYASNSKRFAALDDISPWS